MPRDLADVLHYFLPELPPARGASEPSVEDPLGPEASNPNHILVKKIAAASSGALQPLPILGVPMRDRDVVRAALTWNLAVETARIGGRAVVVAPASDIHTPLWPAPGDGPLGTEIVFCAADNLRQLVAAALKIAAVRTTDAKRGGTLFLRVPTQWIEPAGEHDAPLHSTLQIPKTQEFETPGGSREAIDWWLLMSSSNRRDLGHAFDVARAIRSASVSGAAEVGITIHGVGEIAEAERAYSHIARRCETEINLELISYGLLVDDLHVYRAIASQRPIGLAHPQAPATRALMDVARLIYRDARSQVLG